MHLKAGSRQLDEISHLHLATEASFLIGHKGFLNIGSLSHGTTGQAPPCHLSQLQMAIEDSSMVGVQVMALQGGLTPRPSTDQLSLSAIPLQPARNSLLICTMPPDQ